MPYARKSPYVVPTRSNTFQRFPPLDWVTQAAHKHLHGPQGRVELLIGLCLKIESTESTLQFCQATSSHVKPRQASEFLVGKAMRRQAKMYCRRKIKTVWQKLQWNHYSTRNMSFSISRWEYLWGHKHKTILLCKLLMKLPKRAMEGLPKSIYVVLRCAKYRGTLGIIVHRSERLTMRSISVLRSWWIKKHQIIGTNKHSFIIVPNRSLHALYISLYAVLKIAQDGMLHSWVPKVESIG